MQTRCDRKCYPVRLPDVDATAACDPKPVSFRKPAMTMFGVTALAGLVALYIVVAFGAKQLGAGVFAVAAVNSLGLYVIWVIAPHSAVRMYANGVAVDNALLKHVIPWGDLAEIGVRDGLFFRLC